jgi:hypothetical protein
MCFEHEKIHIETSSVLIREVRTHTHTPTLTAALFLLHYLHNPDPCDLQCLQQLANTLDLGSATIPSWRYRLYTSWF